MDKTEDEEGTRKASSMERAEKYLRRDNSNQMRTQQQLASERDSVSLNKPPRSSSQTGNKQVRFDIKEGLRGMIKESGPAFDAAHVHR